VENRVSIDSGDGPNISNLSQKMKIKDLDLPLFACKHSVLPLKLNFELIPFAAYLIGPRNLVVRPPFPVARLSSTPSHARINPSYLKRN
jgi:hypothetical protein